VIGATTLIFPNSGASVGVGFAVPVNMVKRVEPSLIATGHYADPWLGIEGLSIAPLIAEELGLPVERGVLVQEVVQGGPGQNQSAPQHSVIARVDSQRTTWVHLAGGRLLLGIEAYVVRTKRA
jgi:putative serine protease PepD